MLCKTFIRSRIQTQLNLEDCIIPSQTKLMMTYQFSNMRLIVWVLQANRLLDTTIARERFQLQTALKSHPSTRFLTNTWKPCRLARSSTEATTMLNGVSAVFSRQTAKLCLWIWEVPPTQWLDEAPRRPQPTRSSAKLACLAKARDVIWASGPTKQTLACTSRKFTCKTSSRCHTKWDLIAKI